MPEMAGKSNFAEERATVDLRVLAACADFASKDLERYYLNGVFMEIQTRSVRYVATDGNKLIVYHDAFSSMFENTLIGEYIVPTRICRTHTISKEFWIGEMTRGKSDTALILRYGDLGLDFEPIDGEFPNYRRTIPRNRPSGEAGQFNPDLLVSFVKFGKAIDNATPWFSHDGVENPARVHYADIPALGVVMPRKSIGGGLLPEWLEAA